MDPKATDVLLSLTAFPGANTNAPRGTVPAPELLQNVHLDRTGGYTPMSARSRRLENVTRALAAGRADNLFVETGGGVSYWNAQTGTLAPVPGASTLQNAVTLMPDLLLTPGGYLHRLGVFAAPGTVQAAQYSAGPLALPEGEAGLQPGRDYDLVVQFLPVPGANYRGTVILTNIGDGQAAPYAYGVRWVGASQPPIMRFFLRENEDPYRFIGSSVLPNGRVAQGSLVVSPDQAHGTVAYHTATAAPTDDLTFAVDAATPTAYHQGRVFIAPASATYTGIDTEQAPVTKTDTEPTRIYFSNVIAAAKLDAAPAFTLVNFVDAPFRVSRRVVALASVGPYLYIFGDRELLVLTGDPERDARIESLGDSIGAVSPASVQQLGGTVFWQSDSGVLSVQGGQAREVGEPVRDQLLALGLDVTATVDFRRETYLLTDGVTTLCYHARENGWTTRAKEGNVTPRLLYGGGTPYSLQGATLYSIGGEAGLDGTPPRLPMRVRFPHYELGDWRTRKSFNGLAFGLDLATQYAIVTHLSTVDGRIDQTADTVQTVTAGKAGAVRLHTAQDGVNFSGAAISIELEVETQDSRGILRPPLTVYGNTTGEEMWTDDAE